MVRVILLELIIDTPQFPSTFLLSDVRNSSIRTGWTLKGRWQSTTRPLVNYGWTKSVMIYLRDKSRAGWPEPQSLKTRHYRRSTERQYYTPVGLRQARPSLLMAHHSPSTTLVSIQLVWYLNIKSQFQLHDNSPHSSWTRTFTIPILVKWGRSQLSCICCTLKPSRIGKAFHTQGSGG